MWCYEIIAGARKMVSTIFEVVTALGIFMSKDKYAGNMWILDIYQRHVKIHDIHWHPATGKNGNRIKMRIFALNPILFQMRCCSFDWNITLFNRHLTWIALAGYHWTINFLLFRYKFQSSCVDETAWTYGSDVLTECCIS